MMLELNIKNKKTEIIFSVDNRIKDVKKVYVDTYDNSKNYLSPNDQNHSFKFNRLEILLSEEAVKSEYKITSEQLNADCIVGLYVMTIVYDDATIESKIVYDLNELYCVRVKYLTDYCDTCSTKANYKKLLNLMFKEMLLRNSINQDLIEDSLSYYSDIFNKNCSLTSVSKCSSGLCKIC